MSITPNRICDRLAALTLSRCHHATFSPGARIPQDRESQAQPG